MRLSESMLQTFQALFAEAQASGEPEPSAMTLATCAVDGRVSARTVLLKHVDQDGFVFYTNVESLKGRQLTARPMAALLFHWKHLRQGVQVRIEGPVEPVSDAEADAYFAKRPRESQVGAWASDQSRELADRETFMARYEEIERRYAGAPVPRPPYWSGYRVLPERVEFWYGVPYRLHQRDYHEWRDGGWHSTLLYP